MEDYDHFCETFEQHDLFLSAGAELGPLLLTYINLNSTMDK